MATIRYPLDRRPFEQVELEVDTRCQLFDRLALSSALGTASVGDFKVPGLPEGKMAGLYDAQFSQRRRTRMIRDTIRNSAPNGLCPYCGQGSVYQLDHYLPKSLFAAVTVHPPNLVPSCGDCNFEKREYMPESTDGALIHPYFDEMTGDRWLHASIDQGLGGIPVANFFVRLSERDTRLQARLETHLRVFKLYGRFSQWAAQSLENFENLLTSALIDPMTRAEAKQHLAVNAVQQSGGRLNSWERATFEAMADSEWYLRTHLGLR